MLFTTVDRPDNKQFREFYTSAAALEAAKKGQPLPSGTVITMVQNAAKLDAQGNPEKDANGRFIKTNVIGYTVMEKRTGWGTEYPDNVRNGEWEYQAFKADKTPNTAANLTACFNCHKPLRQAGFRLPLRQDENRGEIGPPLDRHPPPAATAAGHIPPCPPGILAARPPSTSGIIIPPRSKRLIEHDYLAGKGVALVPPGREVVTFSCGYWISRCGDLRPGKGAEWG